MIKPKSAIEKGKLLENHTAKRLREKGLDSKAKREIGSGSGMFKGDVSNRLGWTIECKNTKKFNWKKASEQVKREAMGYQKEVIVWHPPGVPLDNSIAILELEEFLELLKIKEDNKSKEEILDKHAIKRNLESAGYVMANLKRIINKDIKISLDDEEIPNRNLLFEFERLRKLLKNIIKDI